MFLKKKTILFTFGNFVKNFINIKGDQMVELTNFDKLVNTVKIDQNGKMTNNYVLGEYKQI